MDLRSAALLMMGSSSSGGTAKAKDIYSNGTYEPTDDEKKEGIAGYDPIYVNVMPGSSITLNCRSNGVYSIAPNGDIYLDGALIESKGMTDVLGTHYVLVAVPKVSAKTGPLLIEEPGTYYAADYGYKGFSPVTMSDKYYNLLDYLINGGTTNTTDDGIDVPNSIYTGDQDSTNEYLNIGAGDFNTVTNSGNSISIVFGVTKTPHTTQDKYWHLRYTYTVTNLITNESVSGNCFELDYGWNEATTREPLFEITSIESSTSICIVYYKLTRYNEDGTVRDEIANSRQIDHGSVNASTYTDEWFLSNNT